MVLELRIFSRKGHGDRNGHQIPTVLLTGERVFPDSDRPCHAPFIKSLRQHSVTGGWFAATYATGAEDRTLGERPAGLIVNDRVDGWIGLLGMVGHIMKPATLPALFG